MIEFTDIIIGTITAIGSAMAIWSPEIQKKIINNQVKKNTERKRREESQATQVEVVTKYPDNLDASFFDNKLGTNRFFNSNNGKNWRLSAEMLEIKSTVDAKQWDAIRVYVAAKVDKLFKRRDLYHRVKKNMTADQRIDAHNAIKKDALAIAREIVTIARNCAAVTDEQMKFITGTAPDSSEWFSKELEQEYLQYVHSNGLFFMPQGLAKIFPAEDNDIPNSFGNNKDE